MTPRRGAAVVSVLLAVLAVPTPAAAKDAAFTLVAGGNGSGFAGDGGPGTAAKIYGPHDAAVGPDGTLYIADTGNHRVRAMTRGGVISTVAGDGRADGEKGPVAAGIPGSAISLKLPTAVAVGGDGTVFIADSGVGGVYALAPDGSISLRADVSGNGRRRELRGLAVAPDGTLYVSDRAASRVLAFTPDGTSSVVAGTGSKSPIPLVAPGDLAVDGQGDLWIASHHLFRVQRGAVAAVALPADDRWAVEGAESWPLAGNALVNIIAVGAGDAGLYALSGSQRSVRRLNQDGGITAVTDLPADPFGRTDPVQLAAGGAGGPLYLIDTAGSRIFSLEPPSAIADSSGADVPFWIWPAGGLALVVLLGIGIGLARRRR
ncbi:hypothetical protein AB0G04_04940 [Actinoplanes sp. NPDC023801]|uniref:hypothetical protein n=1 Tax=Actinoplanes sp. NPDC023801 TaxID=3154595 RepID=UPI0033CF71D1